MACADWIQISEGSRAFMARCSAAGVQRSETRTPTPWPWACTPASVRPAPVAAVGAPQSFDSTRSISPCTVRASGCRCQPANCPPSYCVTSRIACGSMSAESYVGSRSASTEAKCVRYSIVPPIARLLAALWLLVLGLLVGGAALPRANDAPVLREDYESCISNARSPIPDGDRYGELVEALYACGVYDGGIASG